MKLLLTGLSPEATEEAVRTGMERLGSVSAVQIVPASGPDQAASAIIEMPITDERAFQITRQMQDLWHDGRHLNLTILNH